MIIKLVLKSVPFLKDVLATNIGMCIQDAIHMKVCSVMSWYVKKIVTQTAKQMLIVLQGNIVI
jgi:hypothetical protein